MRGDTYNIFCIYYDFEDASGGAFITEDSPTTQSKALRLSRKYNSIWSRTRGGKETSIKSVVGYCVSPDDQILYSHALKLFKEQN